jgi:Streptomyces sporulation and cell division protein, SsgA
MRDEHTVICSPAVFELTSAEASAVPVKVDLTYHSRDPYAVRASFRTGSSSVEWVFARDLLHGGLVGPSGAGDVRVQPLAGAPAKVQLELSSPSGHAVFTTCATTLGDFLRRTFEAVPAGSEYSWLDFDMALSELLNESAHD